jgi:hypothetical protein
MPWISRARLARLETIAAGVPAMVKALDDRAHLVSINQSGRSLRFLFRRGEKLHAIETYATMDATPEAWRRELLE